MVSKKTTPSKMVSKNKKNSKKVKPIISNDIKVTKNNYAKIKEELENYEKNKPRSLSELLKKLIEKEDGVKKEATPEMQKKVLNTKSWESGESWFNSWTPSAPIKDTVSSEEKSKCISESYNNIRVDIFEKQYVESYAAFLKTRRNMLLAKRALNKAYEKLEIDTLLEDCVE